jgi:hypothetical protein
VSGPGRGGGLTGVAAAALGEGVDQAVVDPNVGLPTLMVNSSNAEMWFAVA